MTPEQLKKARRELGFHTKVAFAKWLGVNRNAVWTWETGRVAVPGPVVRCILLTRNVLTLIDELTCEIERLDDATRKAYDPRPEAGRARP